ncbi:hypothetical protein F5Y07DRAFT_377043 [Xylaria sp. FL0933]|nr:hypothetical protein F5Y07DRAFT_377043 [Xylaria sp. FL0933]
MLCLHITFSSALQIIGVVCCQALDVQHRYVRGTKYRGFHQISSWGLGPGSRHQFPSREGLIQSFLDENLSASSLRSARAKSRP